MLCCAASPYLFASNANAPYAAPDIDTQQTLFTINSHKITLKHKAEIDALCQSMRNDADTVRSVRIIGSSSPDGNVSFNYSLSRQRAQVIRAELMSRPEFAGVPFSCTYLGENWSLLRSIISQQPQSPDRDGLLQIIDSNSNLQSKESLLRRFKEGGGVWRRLCDSIFPQLRYTEIIVDYARKGQVSTILHDDYSAERIVTSTTSDYNSPETSAFPTDSTSLNTPESGPHNPLPDPARHLYIKTNVPAWVMLWINIGIETDIARHWSFSLAAYYSGFNYFTSTRKFRTMAFMPEFRYWPKADNQGFFVAPHFGIGWYNVAFNGDCRYQDHDGKSPAIGGGINLGYRFNISRNGLWKVEASIGAGIYHLDYDIFQNKRNGLLIGRRQRTFYGIDNAALSISYTFDIGKMKGGRK